jgi:hypothetical protein
MNQRLYQNVNKEPHTHTHTHTHAHAHATLRPANVREIWS